jgi:hypothetical protein
MITGPPPNTGSIKVMGTGPPGQCPSFRTYWSTPNNREKRPLASPLTRCCGLRALLWVTPVTQDFVRAECELTVAGECDEEGYVFATA